MRNNITRIQAETTDKSDDEMRGVKDPSNAMQTRTLWLADRDIGANTPIRNSISGKVERA